MLLLDDDPLLGQGLRDRLRAEGHVVDSCRSIAEAGRPSLLRAAGTSQPEGGGRCARALLRLLAVMLALGAIAGCKALPPLDGRNLSSLDEDTAGTRLGRAVQPQLQRHPGLSGIHALANGLDAFVARALLAEAAERTLDVQYYIWHDDLSGRLLFAALRRAADRGVRVRLLLDDNNTKGLDPVLARLDAHPNIEVRLFNPFMQRDWRIVGFLTDFRRLNRRMHNKSFTADNQVTIVGGRNVGDEYFGADEDVSFVDLDVLAVGPVTTEVSRDFDRYWSSSSAYPLASVLGERAVAATRAARATDSAATAAPPAEGPAPEAHPPDRAARSPGRRVILPSQRAYLEAVRTAPLLPALLAGELELEWAHARMVSDDPAKALGRAAGQSHLWVRLMEAMAQPARELALISPYFVPTLHGTRHFTGLAGKGVEVKVLTNALEATDVVAVHAGYARWRERLLEAGVRLYELKRTAPRDAFRDRGLAGSSGSSLHAKTFSVDRNQVFVGSLNFDPRSAVLNTELGFVIDSPRLAARLSDGVGGKLAESAYELRLDAAGRLQWVDRAGGVERVLESEPNAGLWRRVQVFVLRLLPIDWLL